jgi:hypothetical protein
LKRERGRTQNSGAHYNSTDSGKPFHDLPPLVTPLGRNWTHTLAGFVEKNQEEH